MPFSPSRSSLCSSTLVPFILKSFISSPARLDTHTRTYTTPTATWDHAPPCSCSSTLALATLTKQREPTPRLPRFQDHPRDRDQPIPLSVSNPPKDVIPPAPQYRPRLAGAIRNFIFPLRCCLASSWPLFKSSSSLTQDHGDSLAGIQAFDLSPRKQMRHGYYRTVPTCFAEAPRWAGRCSKSLGRQ